MIKKGPTKIGLIIVHYLSKKWTTTYSGGPFSTDMNPPGDPVMACNALMNSAQASSEFFGEDAAVRLEPHAGLPRESTHSCLAK